MNKYIDVMKRTTELGETCLEGLEHIKSRLNQGEFDSTMMMFHESAKAFYQMHKSMQPVLLGSLSGLACAIPKTSQRGSVPQRVNMLKWAGW